MPVVFLIAIIVVLVGIFFAATGRGGEMAYERADHAPLDLGPVTPPDVALLRPPTALWGYNMQVTDEALDQIARAMRERDVTIAYLQEQVASFGGDSRAESGGMSDRQAPDLLSFPAVSEVPRVDEMPETADQAAAIADPAAFPEPAHYSESAAYSEPAASEQSAPYSEPAALEESAPYSEPAASEESAPYSEPAALEESAPYSEPAASEESAPYSEPAAYSEPVAHSDQAVPAESGAPEAEVPTEPEEAIAPPLPRRTPLVLKASPPHDPTQPSEIFSDPDAHNATQPAEEHEATSPSEALDPNDPHGPQSLFDSYGWWAEQKEAAHEEEARRQADWSADEDPLKAEEQGW